LFRPLVTLRLPTIAGSDEIDLEAGNNLMYRSMPEGMAVIVSCPAIYRPLLGALLDLQREEEIRYLVLDSSRFEPIINVLVTRSESYNGLPRFIIRETSARGSGDRTDVAASAGINWRSPLFAEIYVHTKTPYRRQGLGRSVVASLVQQVTESGRTPLYVVNADNQASIDLANSVGFVDIGYQGLLLEGTLKSRT
jgi:GNAT superfamily N-acetyltransferase